VHGLLCELAPSSGRSRAEFDPSSEADHILGSGPSIFCAALITSQANVPLPAAPIPTPTKYGTCLPSTSTPALSHLAGGRVMSLMTPATGSRSCPSDNRSPSPDGATSSISPCETSRRSSVLARNCQGVGGGGAQGAGQLPQKETHVIFAGAQRSPAPAAPDLARASMS
jgi:hypothetical protein